MSGSGFFHISYRHSKMSWTSPVNELERFLRNLLLHPCAKVAVRDKQNLVIVDIVHNLQRRRRSYAHITDCFQFGSGINISHNCVVRIGLFQCGKHLHIQLLCHWTSCAAIGKVNLFLRRKNFYCFCHKSYTTHQHVLLRSLSRLLAQSIRITCVICYLQNLMALVCMRQNADIFFLL